jgi:hypothetical protein
MKINNDELLCYLEILYQTENKIAEIVKRCGLRFSTNKTTADLGEFYVFQSFSIKKDMFESLEPQINSNAEFDLKAKLAFNSILFKYFNKKEIRIEIKTRRNQQGLKYLSSLKPEKFDLLCVVDMSKNYSLNKIYLVTSHIANKYLDKKYKRLIFKDEMAFMTLE